jgi:amino acid adenylation domain-containing protein
VDDDFFLRGGHSLLATRLVSRIRTTLGVELAIRTLFEAPTVSALARRLRGVVPDARPAVVAGRRPMVLPTSYAQQRLWFLDRLQQRSTEYHVRTAWRLRGPLDTAALTRAVQTIVARHESLRTAFVERDGEISQTIAPAMTIEIPIDDVSALDPDPQRQAMMSALAGARDERFDLARGPLMRLRLVTLGPDDHVLVYVVHHIVSDAWSRTVFNRELLALYEAFRDGRPDPLPPLTVQYADYALWQRRYLDDDGLAEERAYWKQQLAGIPDRLDLPTDRPRPAQQTFDAGLSVATVPAELCTALKRLGLSEHATLYMVLLSAFALLLSRYSGQDDILVGSPIANRRDASLEDLIGIFINSLVLRVRVDRDQRFCDLLAQVRNTALDAYKHQDMPFERLVEDLAPQRSMSTSPIVQVLLVVQNVPDQPFGLPDLTVEPVRDETHRVRYDLEVFVRETAGRLTVSWLYNRMLFDRWRIEQMSRHFARVLETMTANPDAGVDDLELLTADERQAIAEMWNPAAPTPPCADDQPSVVMREATRVDVAFDAWAHRSPEALAVLGATEELTYRELHERTTRLARRLQTLGAGRGAVVGVAMRRSPWMLAGLVAVLKSGAAYLPLDPSLPEARLRFVVGDAGAALIVTDGATSARVEGCGAHLVDVDERDAASALDDRVRRDTSADLDDRAYIIYTSGSTGTPKGVAISHRSLANIMADLRVRLGVTEESRLFAVSNVAFDIAATELLLPLTSGASCWVASDTLAGGDAVIREMSSSGCTIAQATPSGWRAILDQGWRGYGQVMGLTAGEPLPLWLAQELLQTCSSVWNLYGPTETAIYSTGHRLHLDHTTVPIGRPVANTQVFVLDQRLRPVPPGVIGELFIGGSGVAMGYVNRPRLTATSFVADPFSDVPGRRLYRTGDLVRSRLDGVIEYVGRRDHQVKLRGFRIELGEIEAAIAAYPGFRDSVVIAREDAIGDARLVAYVVPDGDLPESPRALTDELKRVVKERLPDYMVPSAVVWLPALPLTPSGKVDRKQLPAPDLQADRPAFVAPETDVEKTMVGIWREVIGCGDVGLYDNFFELGGHSLTAIKITARVWRDLGIELPLHVVFDRPVLADMAAYVATCQPDPSQV